jgi:hypothetical protein
MFCFGGPNLKCVVATCEIQLSSTMTKGGAKTTPLPSTIRAMPCQAALLSTQHINAESRPSRVALPNPASLLFADNNLVFRAVLGGAPQLRHGASLSARTSVKKDLGDLGMILRVGVVVSVFSIVVALSHSSIARPADQNQNKPDVAALGPPVVGLASTYNPFRPGYRSGGRETASGELYDQAAWTAAIQTHLRERFGGVRYGKNYRPTYALVASQDKQVIAKIK